MEKTKTGVVMLNRSQLQPHPDNPRKDLGDLEELRESIKEHGIMQNLTVVPVDDNFENFRILIGHRRYAASEGILHELPCVIVEGLSDREQVGIMLCENMQRADLTVFEQAHGFQMMLDLGDTIETISDKTGFSETTVKHRLEINKLKKSSIETAQDKFQLSIGDFIELEKIKDLKERNKILENVYSSTELKDEVDDYLRRKLRAENEKKYIELFNSLGWRETKEYIYSYGDYAKWKKINGLEQIDLDKPFNDETIKAATVRISEPIFYHNSGYYIEFGIKNPVKQEQKKKTKEQLMEEAREKCKTALESSRTEICDLYYKFILQIPDKRIKEVNEREYKAMIKVLVSILIDLRGSMHDFSNLCNIKTKMKLEDISSDFRNYDSLRKLMLLTWSNLASNYSNKFVEWNFTKNMTALTAHQMLFDVLLPFGFRLDDDQKAIIKGTSDLYNAKI